LNLQRETGSYYTPKFLADFIVQWISKQSYKSFDNILEPSCGEGVFIESLLSIYPNLEDDSSIDLVEINDAAAKVLEAKYSKNNNINIFNKDFLDFQNFHTGQYSLVIGNPPYIKRTLLSDEQVLLSKHILESCQSLANTSLKNIWSSFLVRSINFLNEEGVLAFVLPAEILQVDYAAPIRELLLNTFSRIEIFTFNELLFKDCKSQDTLILIAYKKSYHSGLFFSNIDNLNSLHLLDNIDFIQHDRNEKKWSTHTLNKIELDLINKLVNECPRIEDYCTSKPGIVTGANSYFILNKEDIKKYNLEQYALPIIQKSSLIGDNIIFNNSDYEKISNNNIPCYFIDLNSNEAINDNKIKNYLNYGHELKLKERYKIKKRSHWFQVPFKTVITPLLFFKRCHNYPRLVRNYSDVLTTDSAYLVEPKNSYDANSILFSFYNSFTLACAELMGRYYGGGVLELTPKEFKNLPLPYVVITEEEFTNYINFFKEKTNINNVLSKFNECILKSAFPQITDNEIKMIEDIRSKLVKRRQKL